MTNTFYHVPVLLDASIEALNLGDGGGLWMDATFGGGGHSRLIVSKLNKHGKLFGFDQDPDAVANSIDDSRFTLIESNFRYAKQFLNLRDYDVEDIEYEFQTLLEDSSSAAELIKESTWEELMAVIRMYGEVNRPDRLARAIKASSEILPINTTENLIKVLSKHAPSGREKKFYAQVFQALRIEVNDELGALRDLLEQATQLLKPGGRLAIISYHSLEDRLVKHFMRSGNFEDKIEKDVKGQTLAPFKLISRKAIVATPEEVMENPRARSARLRVAERTTYTPAL